MTCETENGGVVIACGETEDVGEGGSLSGSISF
jgi:hypothetical protein